jgi:hypothetical protein
MDIRDNNEFVSQKETAASSNVSRSVFQILRGVAVGISGAFVAVLAWFGLSLPFSAAMTLLPAPFDCFSLHTVWAIPAFALIILAAAYLAAKRLWAFLLICAAGVGIVYVTSYSGEYIANIMWRDTDVYTVAASGDARLMRQMYYDILVRQSRPSGEQEIPIYRLLQNQLKQQIEANRPE